MLIVIRHILPSQAKIVRKTLIPTVFWLLLDFLSLKNDVNVPSKSIKQNNFFLIRFLLVSWRSMTKLAGSGSESNPDPLVRGILDPRIRIRIHTKMSWIRNTGSCVLKTHILHITKRGFSADADPRSRKRIKFSTNSIQVLFVQR